MSIHDTRPAYVAVRNGFYMPRSVRFPINLRPTRNAAGMSFTASRRGVSTSDRIVLALSVYGTVDALRNGVRGYVQTAACGCCGAKSKGKKSLNATGQVRLRTLRRNLAVRVESALLPS